MLEDEAYVLSQRCPKGVISHDDALYYYGLVDREPFVHCITIYSGYNPSALTNKLRLQGLYCKKGAFGSRKDYNHKSIWS